MPAWRQDKDDLILIVRATPSASRDTIEGLAQDTAGRDVLKVRVRAAPEKGKANKAVEKLLASYLNVPRTSVCLTKGATDRLKTLTISNGAVLIDTLVHDFGATYDSTDH